MALLRLLPSLLALLPIGALGQAPMRLCTDETCENCPNSVTTAGTGYPACVVYDRDTVLGSTAGDYEQVEDSRRNIIFDIAEHPNPDCKFIVRSPAGQQDPNCGEPLIVTRGGRCFKPSRAIDPTFMVQFCCGSGDCAVSGVKRGLNTVSSVVLRDGSGNVVVPLGVGSESGDMMDVFMEDLGLNSSSVVESTSTSGMRVFKIGQNLAKRDCDSFTPSGDTYTKADSVSSKIGARICGDGTMQEVTNEMSVSRSTTFGASVGDPFGIVSASTEFTTEESASQSYTYVFTPPEGQCGNVAFTATLNCLGGTITGCEGGDQTGEVCTARRISEDQVDGTYSFVITD
ncbi:hypothetical protein CB0940_09143 [Cercospora beticola]|uniref:Uncharacterized protein n=1 Tax=Cercospora beticola TaxID=122368 RepID=A0A2G5HID9_CERBT|nr:hypothetical protein CB0940_09143 [Cercospora beticola]PIA92334.1 hypothetical protein CB0940_09143 [Cercospora beticola]WPB06568.1 hypothetical protein RHO25_011225 [Cercospora beticola]